MNLLFFLIWFQLNFKTNLLQFISFNNTLLRLTIEIIQIVIQTFICQGYRDKSLSPEKLCQEEPFLGVPFTVKEDIAVEGLFLLYYPNIIFKNVLYLLICFVL